MSEHTKIINFLQKTISQSEIYDSEQAYTYLKKIYNWPKNNKNNKFEKRFEELFKIELPHDNSLENNTLIKNYLNQEIHKKNSNKLKIAKYYISEWGGVTQNSKETIQGYIDRFTETPNSNKYWDANQNIQCIISWSKYLSLLHPKYAFIYDARVVYSLNVINYLIGASEQLYTSPSSRNRKLNLLGIEPLYLNKYFPKFEEVNISTTSGSLKKIDDILYLPKSISYKKYCHLIINLHKNIFEEKHPTYYTEMLLFSIADGVIWDKLWGTLGSKKIQT